MVHHARLTNPIFGFDSYGPTPTAVHHEVRSHFAARYVSRDSGKTITRREYNADKASDIGLVVVFEDGSQNALLGYEQGKSDAEFAAKATEACGRPSGRPIFFAVDFDTTDGVDRIDSYFAGVGVVLGKENCGPYGGISTVGHLLDQGFCWGWQTYAWSGGRVDGRAKILQYANDMSVRGYSVDFDHAYYSDYGQWDYTPPPPAENHQYQRYFKGPFSYEGHTLHEQALVIAYDIAMRHPRLHAKKIEEIKYLLRLDAKRIASKASAHREPGKKLPMEWSAFDRGWRYKEITKRVHGEVVK